MKILSIFGLVVLALVVMGTALDEHMEIIRGAGPVKVVRNTDFDFDVSRGHHGNMFYVNKFGHNDDVDAAEDIWHGGGDYTGFPTGSAELIEVVSTDADDTDGGTGCRTVFVSGLDANYDLQSETVTLAGLTPVDTVNTYIRSNRAYCVTAGTTGTNEGEVAIRHTTTTANVFGYLETGVGQTQIAAYTVPNGYNCYVRSYEVSFSDQSANKAEIGIWVRPEGGAERIVNQFNVSTAYYNSYEPPGSDPLPEHTDLKLRVRSIQNANGHVNFTGSLICVKD